MPRMSASEVLDVLKERLREVNTYDVDIDGSCPAEDGSDYCCKEASMMPSESVDGGEWMMVADVWKVLDKLSLEIDD